MIAKDLISDIVPFLKTSDTGTKALTWMEIFRISHLPIVNEEVFLGLISDADIYDLNMADEPIGNHRLSLIKPYVLYNQHFYEVFELISRLHLSVVPVLNEDKKYLGVITLYDLLQNFANIAAAQNPGGIIVLSLNQNDYSLSEISQIIEGNDVKVLSLYVSSPPQDSMQIEVTIKTNTVDLSSVLQTFYRYGYDVKHTFMGDVKMDSLIENRYDAFMNYLNI